VAGSLLAAAAGGGREARLAGGVKTKVLRMGCASEVSRVLTVWGAAAGARVCALRGGCGAGWTARAPHQDAHTVWQPARTAGRFIMDTIQSYP
jgi:hypothetical protein